MRIRECYEFCLANVNGYCAVERCRGTVIRLNGGRFDDVVRAAHYYHLATLSRADYFGPDYVDEDTEE